MFALGVCGYAHAQSSALAPSAGPAAAEGEQVPRVPGVSTALRGFNAGVAFSAVHDSAIGWYSAVTPAISYWFSPHFAVDASTSIYPYRLVQTAGSGFPPAAILVATKGDAGDTFIGTHAFVGARNLRNVTTFSFSIPTGKTADGLGAGRMTFDFSDRLEHSMRNADVLADAGIGDSSGLFNRLVNNNYTSVGTLAHFQGGLRIWLPGRTYLQCFGYEQHPLGNQTLYIAARPPGAQGPPVESGPGVGADYGVTAYMGVPLSERLNLVGYYSRSIEQHLDTLSIGFAYVFRGNPANRRSSMVDRALREAEEPSR